MDNIKNLIANPMAEGAQMALEANIDRVVSQLAADNPRLVDKDMDAINEAIGCGYLYSKLEELFDDTCPEDTLVAREANIFMALYKFYCAKMKAE